MKSIKVYNRFDKDIPFGLEYIILDNNIYLAFKTIYGVTFRKEFNTIEACLDWF